MSVQNDVGKTEHYPPLVTYQVSPRPCTLIFLPSACGLCTIYEQECTSLTIAEKELHKLVQRAQAAGRPFPKV